MTDRKTTDGKTQTATTNDGVGKIRYREHEDVRHEDCYIELEVLLLCFAKWCYTQRNTDALTSIHEGDLIADYHASGTVYTALETVDPVATVIRKLAWRSFRDGHDVGQASVGTDSCGEQHGSGIARAMHESAMAESIVLPHKREVAAQDFTFQHKGQPWFTSCSAKRSFVKKEFLLVRCDYDPMEPSAPCEWEFDGTTYPVRYDTK